MQHFLYFLPLPQGQGSLRFTRWRNIRLVGAGKIIVLGLSGRGDKDMETVAAATGVKLR